MWDQALIFENGFIVTLRQNNKKTAPRAGFPLREKTKVVSRIVNALQKYGHYSVSLTVILIPNANKESVMTLEQYVIATLIPAYNILKVARSSVLNYLMRQKLSLAL